MGLFRVIFLALILSVFGVGIYDYIYNVEPNGCEMTYMFEYPEYLKIDLNQSVQQRYPRYNLYLYAEGSYAQEAQSSQFRPKGIPVLFIPGNAGSYKQVRSLGSVALQMAKSQNSNFHFNFFALDLHEDYSAFFGPHLQVQTEFAHVCIRHILSMYTGNVRPTTVVIVGHSMGGIIARALFTLLDFDRILVSTIITQATPHQSPVISLDAAMHEFFERVNEYWTDHSDEEGKLGDVTVFSTSGGYRDVQVRSGLTSLKGLVQHDRSTSANTMSVPGAWVSTDHLCHVWCKQIVIATVRALFDIVDKSTRQVAVNPTFRVKPFVHHFVQNVGTKQYKASHDLMLPVHNTSTFEIRKKQAWKFVTSEVEIPRIVSVNLPKAMAPSYGYIAITNVDNVGWVGGCTVRDGRCTQIGNFARYANLIPPQGSGLKVVHLDSYKLDMFEHWAVVIPKSSKPVTMMYDLYKLDERNFEYNVTSFLNFVKNFPSSIYKSDIVLSSTRSRNIFYNISLVGLTIPLQAYTATIETRGCNVNSSAGADYAVAKFHVPWSGEHTYTVIPREGSARVALKLQSGKPEFPVYGSAGNAELHLYLMPQCKYRVSINIAWRELSGQFIRFYATLLPAYLVMQVLMALSWQLMALEEQETAPDFITSHARWAQPYRVCLVASVVRFLISYPEEDNFAKFLGLPSDDSRSLTNSNMWYAALPVLLYLFCYTFFGLYAYLAHYMVVIAASIYNLLFGRFVKSLERLANITQYVVLTGGAICSATMCGTIGILVTYIVYTVKLWNSYIEGREAETRSSASSGSCGARAGASSETSENCGQKNVSSGSPAAAEESVAEAGEEVTAAKKEVTASEEEVTAVVAAKKEVAASEEEVTAVVKATAAAKRVVIKPHWNKFNINFSLVLLLLLSIKLNAPSFVAWIENLSWGKLSLDVDPSCSSGVIICVAAILINFSPFPFTKHELTSVMGGICYACCVLMVLYATSSVYRVTHFINASLMIIAVPSALVALLDTNREPQQQQGKIKAE